MLIIRALIQLITPIGHWIPLNTAATGLLLRVTVCAVSVPYNYTPLSVKKICVLWYTDLNANVAHWPSYCLRT